MIIGLVVTPLLLAVFIAVLLYYIGYRGLQPAPSPRAVIPSTRLPITPIEIDGEIGKLRGWLVPAQNAGSAEKLPAILLTHGWGRNAAQMLPYAEFLHADGYHLCLFDVRNHGNSDADSYVNMLRYSDDIVAAARWLASRPEVDAGRLGHLGHSMGAASSLRAARISGLFRCLVFSSGFADLGDLTAWMLQSKSLPVEPMRTLLIKFWEHRLRIPLTEVNPIDNVKQLKLPMLLAHGENDAVVPAAQMPKLAAAAVDGNVETLFLSGRQHSNLYADPLYVKTVRAFFVKHL